MAITWPCVNRCTGDVFAPARLDVRFDPLLGCAMTTLEAVLHPARALGAGPLGRKVALGLLLAVLLFLTA